MTAHPVRLILDTTALTAYGQGLIDVGETIGEAVDNGGTVGLPIACLAEALPGDTDGLVDMLARSSAAVVLPLDTPVWPALGATVGLLGDVGAASALLAAEVHDCDILTAQPGAYGPLGDDPPIIPV